MSAAVVVALIVGALAGGTAGLVVGVGLASARLPQNQRDRLRHSSDTGLEDIVLGHDTHEVHPVEITSRTCVCGALVVVPGTNDKPLAWTCGSCGATTTPATPTIPKAREAR